MTNKQKLPKEIRKHDQTISALCNLKNEGETVPHLVSVAIRTHEVPTTRFEKFMTRIWPSYMPKLKEAVLLFKMSDGLVHIVPWNSLGENQ